ncbi:Alpha/beta hydrolase fold-3 [Macrophomina phaseolina MS6]|uniref:Alpha/beta hydrolase fold-3 n=1 Tax=Macrophomina phaseolina (strain MS6) TaxID=1126212 RepID=K2RU47_MACPH|nr:Alpha/beta hydrolase fold-3 [Macrophomina phaseolina MS6]
MEKKEYTFKEISNTLIAADVYYTKENAGSKSPIALHFHGGNFVVGSKALLGEQHVKKLLELGFIVVSANYRLCPTTTVYDGPVQDAFDAYNWARTTLPGLLKSDAGIEADGSRIVVFGHSCGATLGLLTVSHPNSICQGTTN